MKLTYVATNRAHHYPYALQLHDAGVLEAFVSGFSRLSPRARLPQIGKSIVHRDFFQSLYVLSLRAHAPNWISKTLNQASNRFLDSSSFTYASRSDIFLYYRTTGMNTARRIPRGRGGVMCVLEEVNSHVTICDSIMREEFDRLGMGGKSEQFPDHEQRLIAYEEADFILCPSEWVVRSFIDQGFPPEKLLKNPYGFQASSSIESLRESKLANTEAFRILFVGQLHYRKGLRYLIEAFRRLKHPRKELVLVGPQTATTGLEGISLPDGVRLTGILKGEALANEYKAATLFCLPSLEEGLALVMGEALSFGLPILATDQTGADDLFNNGEEGWIIPIRDSNAIFESIQRWADEPYLLEQMAEKARARATTLGGWESSGQRLVATLELTLNQWRNR